MNFASISAAAINGIDFIVLKDKIPDIETYTNEEEYNKLAKLGEIGRESAVINAAILHEKLRIHFNQEDSIKILCAMLQGK